MAATEDDVPQNQSALTEKVEQEERELPTSSGAAIEELLQVEKKVQPVTEEPHEIVKTNSQVEIANKSISDNLEHRNSEQFSKSPILIEIAGEKNSTSSQVHNGNDMTNEASRGKSNTNLIAEGGLRYQEVEISGASVPGTQPNAEESRDLNKDEVICVVEEDDFVESQEVTVAQTTGIKDHLDATVDIIQEVEITVTGASVPGTQPKAEESRDLNKDEAICLVQEDTIMESQEATSAQIPGIEDHLDTTQDINLEIAKLSGTGNQGADQQNTSNTPTAYFQDQIEVGLQIERETDSAISSNLDSKKMEPQGLNSSQNVEDETTEEVQRSLAHTRKFPSGIVRKSDQTEMEKEESQDTEALAHTVHLEDEPTEKIELLRDVSTETEFKGSGCTETTKEVQSLSEHTGNVSTETECSKEHRETTEGNTQDAERVIQSTNIDNETTKKVEISPDLAENVSTGIGIRPGSCEMIEGNFEDHTILLHSAILEEETTEKVESLSEHTIVVSIETECCSDPSKVSKSNTQDGEKLSHSVDVLDENIEKAGNSPDFARNVSIATEDRSNYIEVTKEETSDDAEMNILGAESGEISREVKSTNDGKEKEILESERSDIGSANVAISSTGNCSSKSEKEDVENSSYVEQVSSPMISAFTGEILLKDVGPENVQEIEAHSGTIFEKEQGKKEDTSCTEPALVKEVSDMVPAKENQTEVEKQNMFLEDVATENSTECVMSKAKEMPASSSNDLVMKERETLGKKSQEQVLVELLTGEGIHDEVSKGLTEINIEVEVPVKPEISNTEKDLEALLPKNEPGKENRNEFLQEASGPLQKIDSSQHFERGTSVQEQRSTELLEGDLFEEKGSTNNASKSKADNSLQENTETDNADPNDTAQKTYKTEDNDSEEGEAPQPKEDQIAAEVVNKDFCKDKEKEMQIINKDEVTKEYLIEVSVAAKNKSHYEAMNHEADDIHERAAVYRNDAEDIKGNDSMEGALELKEDQISAEQVDRDTSEKDDKKETQVIDEEEVDTASVESSFKEEKLSDHKVTSEITNPEADEVHQKKVDHLNDNKEIEGNSEEEAPEPKEYQIAAKEDTFNKDEEERKRIIDEQEMATESLTKSSITEENKLHYKLETEPINPEADDVHKQDAFFSNDDEKMKGHIEERAADIKQGQIIAGEAHKDIFSKDEKNGPQILDKEMAATKYLAEEEKSDLEVTAEVKIHEADEFHEGNKEIKDNDSEGVTKPKDQIEAEVQKDMFSKDEEKEMKMMNKEVTTENLVESSIAKEHESGHKVMAEETIPDADELQRAKADHIKDDEDPKGSNSEEEVPEPSEHIAEEKIDKETFSMDEVKEAQIIDKEKVATEHLEEDNKSSHEATHPEADDVHKGTAVYRNGDEREPGLRKDQILDEEECQDTFNKDENKDTKIKGKELAPTEYLGESHVANENKSDHKITTKATNQGDDDDEEIIGNDSEEIAAEFKVDQIAAEEAQKGKICEDAEKETQIIEEQEVATEYSLDSCVAEFNESDDKATNPKADDVDKREAADGNDDEKIRGFDSEKAEPEQKYQILAEEACKDEEEDAQIIEKREVAEEYPAESIVVEENMSSHMDKIEVTNPDFDELHKGKADHPNDGEATQGNDPEKVATELNEEHMAEKEETNREVSDSHYGAENIDPVDETTTQNELQEPVSEDIIADKIMTWVPNLEKIKEEFQPEHDFATSSAEEMKAEVSCEESQREELNREGTHQHHHIEKQIAKETDSSNDYHPKSLEKEVIQESFQEDEENKQKGTNTQMNKEEILNLAIPISMQGERLVEERLIKEKPDVMEPETETKDVNIESTTQNDKAAYTTQEEEKVKAKNEGNSGVNAGTDRLAEGLISREYQEQPENYNAAPKTSAKNKVKMLDTVELAKMQPVEGSLKKEEQDVLESHEKGTKDAGIASIMNNDGVTHSAQGKETDIVMQEGNAEVLAEGLPPGEYQEQAANFVTALENSKQTKKEVLDSEVSIEIRLLELSSKQEEWESMEPKKKTKKLDTAGTTENDDATLIPQECERGNPDAASAPALKEKMPLRENDKISENSSLVPDISEETKKTMLDATESAEVSQLEETLTQEEWVITEQEKETRELHVECKTQEDDAKHTAESTNRMTDTSEEWNEKTLDTKELTDIRPVEGTLEQEERVVMEQGKETKDLHIAVIIQNNEASHSAEESEKMMLKHEENINAAGTSKIAEKLPPREHEELENSSEVPELSKQSREKMTDTMEKAATRSVERSMKQDEWVVLEPEVDEEETEMKNIMHGANADAARDIEDSTIFTEALRPREYQERAENLNPTIKISEQSKEKILDVKMSTEIRLVEENLKQEDWDVMRPEKEEKTLDREDTVQNDEATLTVKEAEKDTIKQEGHPDDADTNTLGEELSARKHQELAKTPSEEPGIFSQRNEKMLDTKRSTEGRPVEETLRQEEQVVMEQEDDAKYSHIERTTENSEALNTAQECQKETVNHDRNLDAAETHGLTEGLGAREYQELTETSIVAPNISEEINETILDSMGTKEIKLVEGISKQMEWDVMEPEKETKDWDRKDTIKKDEVTLTAKQGEKDMVEHVRNPDASSTEKLPPTEYYKELAKHSSVAVSKVSKKDEATLSAKVSQKDTIKTEGNPDDAGTSRLTEELPTRECEELAGNSIVLNDISKERNEKLLATRESIEIISVEGILKEKEWEVKGQEKETKDLHEEVRTDNDEATYSAKDGENVMRNEENANVADKNRMGEELIPREHQELAEDSSPLLDNSDTSKDKMSEITESPEIIQVEISKPEEWYVIEQEEKIRNLDPESTKQNDAMLSAQDVEKDMVKLKGHPDARGTGMLIEGLVLREYQGLPENSIPMLENRKEKILESEMIQGKEGQQKEWHVMQQEKEIKDLDKGTTPEDKATISEQEAGKESSNYVGIPDAALTEKLVEGLPPREYQELAEKSCIVPNISEERNEITLNTRASLEIEPVEGSSKQEEWDGTEPEDKMIDLESHATLQNHEAMHSEHESKMETDRHKGHPDAAGIDRLTKGLPAKEYQEQAENSSTGEEWDAIEPEKERKDLDSTTQKDEITLPVGDCEKETVKHEGNQDAADTNRLREGFPPGEYQERAENSSVVAETSEERDKKIVDAIGSTVMNPVEGISEQDEWNIKEPEKETKDFHIEEITQNDQVTHSVQGVGNMDIKHQGNANSASMDRLAEEFPQREYQELVENFIVVPDMSEEDNEKKIDITDSKVIIPVEGSIKPDEWDVLEPQKEIKDADIEDTIMDKEATDLTLESEKFTVGNEGDTIGTVRVSEGLSQREFKEFAENSSAMPEVSDKSKEKMLDNMEPAEIAVIGDVKEVQVQENLQLDNNTPTPEKVDQEEVPKPEVHQRSKPVDSDSGTTITEVKTLNETDKGSKVLPIETDNKSHAQQDIDRKDTEVNSSSACTASMTDVTVGESPEQLRESMVSEDKPVRAVNDTNEDHKKDEDVAKVDINTLSLLEHETPHCSPNESTCNIRKKHEVINPEEQEDNTEKAGILLTGTSEHEQINATEKTEQNHHMLETGSTHELKAKAQESSSRDEEKQQLVVDTVPQKTEKLEITELQKPIPGQENSAEREKVFQLQQETIRENFDPLRGGNPEPSEVKPEVEAPSHWEEKGAHEETTLASMPRDASSSLHDLLQTSKKDISWVTDDLLPETEPYVAKEESRDVETEKAQNEEPVNDEEGEGDEDKRKESAYDSPVTVEAPSDIDVKAAQKKSHNILSGVGSKVKQSIKKVRKAITGKSSHPKPRSPK